MVERVLQGPVLVETFFMVRVQENTKLLSFCGLTGTPQRVSLLGVGGKGCSCCVHSMNVEDVGLRLPLLAES